MGTTITVSTEAELNQAIASADAATSGSFDIVFATPTITEGTDTGQPITFGTQDLTAPPDLYAFNLASGVSVTIDGGGNTLDGDDLYRGLFAYAGDVTIQNLTIADAYAVGGTGGAGGGGGGAGLGGGLFVATGATVTLNNTTLSDDQAIGGHGGGPATSPTDGGGGGGGMGGSGGAGAITAVGGGGGGGGGIGSTAGGGTKLGSGAVGVALGAASGGSGGNTVGAPSGGAGGADGGGGGGGLAGGGGGGIGGQVGASGGASGGFGGGGGGGSEVLPRGFQGGTGGFAGGGGGANNDAGGFGGFGGGGGEGNFPGYQQAGFGAGDGGTGGGGGGLGAGGDVFVQQGGALTVEGGSLSGGSVQGGAAGGTGAVSGSAYSSGIFLQGTAAITLAPLSGETLSLGDALADQNIAGGTQPAATVAIDGPGEVVASGTGDITVGDLQVVGTGATLGLLFLEGVTLSAQTLTNGVGLTHGLGGLDGFGTVNGAFDNEGVVLAGNTVFTPATLEVTGNVSGTGGMLIAPNAELALDGTVGAGQTIGFFLGSGTLDAAATLAMDGTIEHFVTGDTINLPGVSFDSATLAPPAYSDGTLTISNTLGTVLDTLDISGSYVSSDFTLSADSTGGTKITTDLPCFAAGTRIATERGEVAVEALRVGDRVHTVSGALRPVAWIGHRLVDCARHPRAENVWPVRVLAHAFGEGLPARDLVLSPDHALFVDGVLMPVRHLVNGAVIAQQKVDRIHYFHIELARHDVLLAEGLPAESYLDTGNRHVFANGRAHMALHPEFEPLDWYDDAYAPLCVRGKKLEAAKQRLLAEALRRGWRISGAADLHVLAGERRLRAAAIRGKLHQFLLPAGARELRIVSHAGVPAEVDPGSDDRRLLGVQLSAVFVDGKLLALESDALAEGFHAVEGSAGKNWRWTDGAALLRLPAPLPRPATLELLVRDTMRYWQHPEERIAAAAGRGFTGQAA